MRKEEGRLGRVPCVFIRKILNDVLQLLRNSKLR